MATHAPVYCKNTLVWTAIGGAGFTSCTIVTSAPTNDTATATCAGGYTMTGGGCTSAPVGAAGPIVGKSYPSGASTWLCTGLMTTIDGGLTLGGGGPYDAAVMSDAMYVGFSTFHVVATAYAICCH